MDVSPPDRPVPFNRDHVFRRGMERRLLLCILLLALLPLILAGWISHQAACNRMEQEIIRTVRINAELKSQQIKAYLHSRMADAERKGHEPATISFFNDLMRRKAAAGKILPGVDFNAPGNSEVSDHRSDLQLPAHPHGYHDTLMIDRKGSVVFSGVDRQSPTGSLDRFQMAETGISGAFRETIDTGNPVFFGFESGVAEDNGMRGFITAAIGGLGEPPVGVIAFEIPGSDIQQRLNMFPEPGPNMRIYLIDADLTLLAGTVGGQPPGTRLAIKSEIAQHWREAAADGRPALPPSDLIRYRGPGGHQIVGTYAPIQLGRSSCALVAEMDRSMAYAPIHHQQMVFLAIAILTAVGAVAVTLVLTRTLIEPVRKLTDKEFSLLKKTREQEEQLKHRETALDTKTRELKKQSQAFQRSEQVLQLKHLELEAANAQMAKNAADLEANMAILEAQKKNMLRQNAELEKAHRELADKASQLEISSQYKTEFMANMSHELRTPLNSILLLSRLLMEDKEKTLTAKQAAFAHTVHSAGEDLLNLINEILDLAKVESGKIEIESAPVPVQSIARAMQGSFTPLAEQSGIAFSIHMAPDVPGQLISDRKRIEQIVKNFLSNAFKFTPHGSIRLTFSASSGSSAGYRTGGSDETGWLSISVADTGIGIPKTKQEMVFDAFQQVDGSTRRKYGGTGLGLSISRELAHMLGGEITLESEEGIGSCFTLHLPLLAPSSDAQGITRGEALAVETDFTSASTPVMEDTAADQGAGRVSDDRHQLAPDSPCILIIDENVETIETIMATAQGLGYKAVVAEQRMTGLHFADYYRPCAAFINSHLSGSSAWPTVGQLKTSLKNISMPVFTLSSQAEHVSAAIHGAAGHILLPPDGTRLAAAFRQIENWRCQRERTVLVVASNPQKAAGRTMAAVGLDTIRCIHAGTARAARKVLDSHAADAAIWHPTMAPAEQRQFLLDWMARPIPIVLYTGAAPNTDYRTAIDLHEQLADLTPIHSSDQLLTTLLAYLHLPPEALDDSHRSRLDTLINCQSPLKGRRVLLVDDDMRTVFAVTSALEDHGVEICTGKTGKESLDKLDSFPDIDLILMDVMIAEVDGYEAIRTIRRRNRHRHVPILALTAKAMQGDRAKCIAAGADDYLAKPVNLDKLTSMLKVWLDPRMNGPYRIHD